VLDLACGTGAMVRRLAARLPDAILFGADLSRPQLRAAACAAPGSRWSEQRHRPPLHSGAFDVVHWSWLLEHVRASERGHPCARSACVLGAGGRGLDDQRVDNDSLAFWPRIPLAEEIVPRPLEVQEEGGGTRSSGASSTDSVGRRGYRRPGVPHHLPPSITAPAGYFTGCWRSSRNPRQRAESLPDSAQAARRRTRAAQVLGSRRSPERRSLTPAFAIRAPVTLRRKSATTPPGCRRGCASASSGSALRRVVVLRAGARSCGAGSRSTGCGCRIRRLAGAHRDTTGSRRLLLQHVVAGAMMGSDGFGSCGRRRGPSGRKTSVQA